MEEALFSKGKNNYYKKNKFLKGQRFHKSKASLKFFNCHKGHFKRNYPELKRKPDKKSKEHSKADFSIGDEGYDYTEVLVANNEKTMNERTKDRKIWCLTPSVPFI